MMKKKLGIIKGKVKMDWMDEKHKASLKIKVQMDRIDDHRASSKIKVNFKIKWTKKKKIPKKPSKIKAKFE